MFYNMGVMSNHTITNVTSSMLDMSPLRDLAGHVLTLKPGESRDVDGETFQNDILQRVLKASWIAEGTPAKAAAPAPAAPTPAPAAPPEPPAAVTPPPAPEPEPAPEAAPTPAPAVETTTTSETPSVSRTSTKKK